MKTLLSCACVILTLCLFPAVDNAYGQFQVVGLGIAPAPGQNDTMRPSRLPNGTGANQLKPLRANLTATGASPSTQIPITLAPDAVEGTGGHVQAHHNARTGTPQGVAINLNGVVNPATGNMTFGLAGPGFVNTYWHFDTNFTAPEPSGDHNITATVQGTTASTIIHVQVQNLVALQAGGNVRLVGGTNPHPNANSHYGTQGFVNAIPNIANNWRNWFLANAAQADRVAGNELLHVNDMSLVWGGLFDINANWTTPHQTHREGIDGYIWVWNNSHPGIPIGGMGSGRNYRPEFEDIVRNYNANARAPIHNGNHIHIDWD